MTYRLLAVDDDPNILRLLQVVFDWADVDTAPNGRAALTRLTACTYDLVILDVMMPGLTGPEVLAEMRTNPATADIPVLVLTARGDRDDVTRTFQTGGDAHMTKPFDPDLLEMTARQILASSPPERQVERMERLLALAG